MQNVHEDGGNNLKVYFALLFLFLMKPTVGACEMKADFKFYVVHNLKHFNSDYYYYYYYYYYCYYYNK